MSDSQPTTIISYNSMSKVHISVIRAENSGDVKGGNKSDDSGDDSGGDSSQNRGDDSDNNKGNNIGDNMGENCSTRRCHNDTASGRSMSPTDATFSDNLGKQVPTKVTDIVITSGHVTRYSDQSALTVTAAREHGLGGQATSKKLKTIIFPSGERRQVIKTSPSGGDKNKTTLAAQLDPFITPLLLTTKPPPRAFFVFPMNTMISTSDPDDSRQKTVSRTSDSFEQVDRTLNPIDGQGKMPLFYSENGTTLVTRQPVIKITSTFFAPQTAIEPPQAPKFLDLEIATVAVPSISDQHSTTAKTTTAASSTTTTTMRTETLTTKTTSVSWDQMIPKTSENEPTKSLHNIETILSLTPVSPNERLKTTTDLQLHASTSITLLGSISRSLIIENTHREDVTKEPGTERLSNGSRTEVPADTDVVDTEEGQNENDYIQPYKEFPWIYYDLNEENQKQGNVEESEIENAHTKDGDLVNAGEEKDGEEDDDEARVVWVEQRSRGWIGKNRDRQNSGGMMPGEFWPEDIAPAAAMDGELPNNYTEVEEVLDHDVVENEQSPVAEHLMHHFAADHDRKITLVQLDLPVSHSEHINVSLIIVYSWLLLLVLITVVVVVVAGYRAALDAAWIRVVNSCRRQSQQQQLLLRHHLQQLLQQQQQQTSDSQDTGQSCRTTAVDFDEFYSINRLV